MSFSDFGKWIGAQDATTIIVAVVLLLATAILGAMVITKGLKGQPPEQPQK